MKQVEYYKNGNRTLRIKYEGIKKLLEKKDKEIERLKKENAILKQTMCDESLLINENALLKDIIKEVREYIEKYDFITGYYEHNYDDGNDTYTHYTVKEELLEILDKENK